MASFANLARPQIGTDIIWDDLDGERKSGATTALMHTMSYVKVRVGKLQMAQKGLLAKLQGKSNKMAGGRRAGLRRAARWIAPRGSPCAVGCLPAP
jgi:hypothetical protein